VNELCDLVRNIDESREVELRLSYLGSLVLFGIVALCELEYVSESSDVVPASVLDGGVQEAVDGVVLFEELLCGFLDLDGEGGFELSLLDAVLDHVL